MDRVAMTRTIAITAAAAMGAAAATYLLAHHVYGPVFDSPLVQETLFSVVFPMAFGA